MSETTTHSDKNRQHFDTRATSYDADPWVQVMLQQFTEEFRDHKEWIGVQWIENEGTEPCGRQVKLLDYACGPGVASRAFLPYVTKVRGIDVSGAMVDEYNQRAKAQGLKPEVIHAARGDVTDTSATSQSDISASEFWNFDLAVVSMAFHHFEYPEMAAKKLVERLKPAEGILLILDWAEDGSAAPGNHRGHGGHDHGHSHSHGTGHSHGHSHGRGENGHWDNTDETTKEPQAHPAAHTVAHNGFSKDRVVSMFKAAGCMDIDYIILKRPFKFGGEGPMAGVEKKLFMARGKRAGRDHSEL